MDATINAEPRGTIGARLVRQCRQSNHLTQQVVARRAGVPQSSVARAESGAHDLRVDGLERLIRAAGWQLVTIPTLRRTVDATAAAVRDDLARGREDAAFRDVLQLNDDLLAERGAMRVVLTIAAPGATGDVRYDALIAGLVEWRLARDRLPRPEWLTIAPRLRTPWWVDPSTADDAAVAAATPSPLRRRGVFLDEAELASA
jgi:transcriptional regulator with XRE-family HTH domain